MTEERKQELRQLLEASDGEFSDTIWIWWSLYLSR